MASLQPAIRFTLNLLKVPASLGTTVYRWSTRPLADAGAWSEARILQWGSIERSLSNAQGDYDVATCDVTIDDSDGLFRGLLADPSTRIFTGREAAIELLSDAGRAAGTAWRTLCRGHLSAVQAPPGRKVTLRIADCVGSNFSGFDLEKKIGVPITRVEHPNAPDKAIGRIYPIVIGEHSDIGTVDENGDAADKGMLPVIDVGDYLISEDGETIDGQPLAQLGRAQNLDASVTGTTGSAIYTYSVTAVSPYGETTPSATTIGNAPDLLSGTDSVVLTWDEVEGAIEYRVYRRAWANSGGSGLVARLNNGESYIDPETTWTDTGATASGQQPPSTNTARVDQVLDDGSTAFGWGRLILKIGAAAEVHHIYASNLADGVAPKRVRMPESVYGDEFLIYGREGWPHADPFITINGIQMGVAYARGPRLEAHRKGGVTIAWNGCGDDDVGDGSGTTIDEAFPALQHVINEYWLKDSGVGYKAGVFGPLDEWSNGVAKLKTSAFAAMQALTVTWIGGRGYLAAFAITEPTSGREFLRKFCVTFDCHVGVNHHGQMYPVLIDDTAVATSGRIYRDRIEVISFEGQDFDHDAVETKIKAHWDYDTDAQKFRITDRLFEDTFYSDAYGAPRQKSDRSLYCTRDEATAVDSISRHITRYKVAPRYPAIKTDLTGLEDELGAQIRLTHYDGAGGVNGDSATPLLVFAHRTNPQAPETTVLKGFDLGRILSTGLPLLATDASGFVLGDETSSSAPSTGAYELR